MSVIASFIVPTHNRSGSVKQLLDRLKIQSFPVQNFEVIIVANGCTDNTAELVRNYDANFQLRLCEREGGLGPAPARNLGASVAQGRYLIFSDDDMELSTDFIKEHVANHTHENCVVIGYSPFKLEPKATLQRRIVREWWEDKFQKLRNKGHRFHYDDLTSGNFSVSSTLFNKVNGFHTGFPCRDDYELGYRLIEAGAEFCFAYQAKAFHNDKVTNLHRSLQRKRVEAAADIQFQRLHPQFYNKQAALYFNTKSLLVILISKTIRLAPFITDRFAHFGFSCMHYFEKLKMRTAWLKIDYRLHQYWYLRGLLENFRSLKELRLFLNNSEKAAKEKKKLTIDLQQGLKNNEAELDKIKPMEMDVYFGKKFIGTIEYEPGAEPIKGKHLRKLLKDRFAKELSDVLLSESPLKINQ